MGLSPFCHCHKKGENPDFDFCCFFLSKNLTKSISGIQTEFNALCRMAVQSDKVKASAKPKGLAPLPSSQAIRHSQPNLPTAV